LRARSQIAEISHTNFFHFLETQYDPLPVFFNAIKIKFFSLRPLLQLYYFLLFISVGIGLMMATKTVAETCS
jgi:hypothetical protein